MTANKDQHWVSSSYLQAWTDPNKPGHYEPFVHIFNRRGGEHRRKSPKNIFNMPDLYTIFAGEQRDLSLEQHLSRLERDFVRVRKLIEAAGYGDSTDVAALYGFVAAMIVRPPQKIDHMAQQWSSIVANARTIRIDPKIKPIPRVGRDHSPGMTLDEAQRMADDPMGTWFPHWLNAYIGALTELFGCDILINGSPYPFLTSDNPAVVYWPPRDEDASGRVMPARGLGSPGCQITMPLSPTHALLFTHKPPGVHDWRVLDWEGVFDINFRTITRAHTTIVSDREDLFFVQTVLDLISQHESAGATR
jgi:Protein of unknown function (DUF4238)